MGPLKTDIRNYPLRAIEQAGAAALEYRGLLLFHVIINLNSVWLLINIFTYAVMERARGLL